MDSITFIQPRFKWRRDPVTRTRTRHGLRKTLAGNLDLKEHYPLTAKFLFHEHAPVGVESLDFIARVIPSGRFAIIHGEPTDEGREHYAREGFLYRRNTPRADAETGKIIPPHFRDRTSRLITFDFDGIPLPGFDYRLPEDSARKLVAAIGFERAAALWQLTASQKTAPGSPARLRLYFISDHGLDERQRKSLTSLVAQRVRLALDIDPHLDPSIAGSVQPIYISAPEIVGGADPIPRRFGTIPGGLVSLDLDLLKEPVVPERLPRFGNGVEIRDLPSDQELFGYFLPNAEAQLHAGMVNVAFKLDGMSEPEMVEAVFGHVESLIDWSASPPRRPSRAFLRKEVADLVRWVLTRVDAHLVRDIQPAFPPPVEVMTLAEGERVVERALREGMTTPGTLVLQVPAGVGKTEQALRLAKELGLRVHIYVQTHALAEEVADRARAMGMTAQVMKGRESLDDDRKPICKKADAIQHLHELGVRGVGQFVCESASKSMEFEFAEEGGETVKEEVESWTAGGEVCPYARDCTYYLQHDTDAQVVVFQHALLPIPESLLQSRMPKPDVVIIDEDPLKSLVAKGKVSCLRMTGPLAPLRYGIDDISFYDRHELESLKERLTGVRPSMDAAQTLAAAQRLPGGIAVVVEMLLACMKQNHHFLPDVRVEQGVVHFSWVRRIERGAKHVILLDATVRPAVVESYLPRARFVAVKMDDNIDAFVVADRSYSKTATKEKRTYVAGAAELAQHLAKLKRLGVVAGKDQAEQLGDLDVLTFGALRGQDSLRDRDLGLVIGRMQPPIEEVARLARALFPGRKFAGAKLVERPAGYRMADGSRLGVKDFYATCSGPEAGLLGEVMGSLREDELLQGLGRFRAVRRKGGRLPVLILGGLPVDVTVKEVLKATDVRNMNLMLDYLERWRVMPFVAELLVRRGGFRSAEGAKKWLTRGRAMETARRLVELLADTHSECAEGAVPGRGVRGTDNAVHQPRSEGQVFAADGWESTALAVNATTSEGHPRTSIRGAVPTLESVPRSAEPAEAPPPPGPPEPSPAAPPPSSPPRPSRRLGVLRARPGTGSRVVALVSYRLEETHRFQPADFRAYALVLASDLDDARRQLTLYLRAPEVDLRDEVVDVRVEEPAPPDDPDELPPPRPLCVPDAKETATQPHQPRVIASLGPQ